MSTFLIKNKVTITRQSGDDANVVFNVPTIYPVTESTFLFKVFKPGGKDLITIASVDMIINDQRIEIPLAADNTATVHGTFSWELVATRNSKKATIGMGDFIIVKTSNNGI